MIGYTRSSTVADNVSLNDILHEWLTDVEVFASALVERLPPHAENAADLDPATRWGMAWAIKTLTSIETLLEAWRELAGIEGNTTPGYLDNDPAILTLSADVLGTLSHWRDRFGDQETLQAALTDARDLYIQFPGETGQ
ncbi:hypothetical protein FHR32_008397 [Streptosporangium album]|uniref:Uncharacterized protein n=1 Tax=Streptosporangium album TaxID=47479 RepID=A0A7W7WEC4_9ACTN|nr:hypothetical protein [Streptosporangium album]MBB4943996.1 hypothetical protein [Streptosporangium album]